MFKSKLEINQNLSRCLITLVFVVCRVSRVLFCTLHASKSCVFSANKAVTCAARRLALPVLPPATGPTATFSVLCRHLSRFIFQSKHLLNVSLQLSGQSFFTMTNHQIVVTKVSGKFFQKLCSYTPKVPCFVLEHDETVEPNGVQKAEEQSQRASVACSSHRILCLALVYYVNAPFCRVVEGQNVRF